MTTTQTRELIAEAHRIAGCGYDDYAPAGSSPAERCRAAAAAPSLGSDGDYSEQERARLLEIADQLDAPAA